MESSVGGSKIIDLLASPKLESARNIMQSDMYIRPIHLCKCRRQEDLSESKMLLRDRKIAKESQAIPSICGYLFIFDMYTVTVSNGRGRASPHLILIACFEP